MRDGRDPVPTVAVSVLLVEEDNQDAREMLALLLEGRGFHRGRHRRRRGRADERAVAGDYDAAVVDIGLPGLDGYEVARQVRAAEAAAGGGRPILLIALSGYGRSKDRERSGRGRQLRTPPGEAGGAGRAVRAAAPRGRDGRPEVRGTGERAGRGDRPPAVAQGAAGEPGEAPSGGSRSTSSSAPTSRSPAPSPPSPGSSGRGAPGSRP